LLYCPLTSSVEEHSNLASAQVRRLLQAAWYRNAKAVAEGERRAKEKAVTWCYPSRTRSQLPTRHACRCAVVGHGSGSGLVALAEEAAVPTAQALSQPSTP